MNYINNLDSNFLLNFSKKFFKQYYNSDNIFIEKAGNSCVVKCRVNNKHTLIISLKDFTVDCNDVLCGMLAKSQLQKALSKHYGTKYLNDLKEYLIKLNYQEQRKNISKIEKEISLIRDKEVK